MDQTDPGPAYQITMRNCAFFARHGMMDEEERLGQRFYVDVRLTVVPKASLDLDSIENTVDYSVVYEVIERIMTGERRRLIETLAMNCAKALTRRFPQIRRAEVTVRKPNAPVRGVFDHVEVTIVWPE